MQIRLLVPRAAQAGPQNIGDVLTVPDAEAISMIEAGQAVPVAPEPEHATRKATKAEKRDI